MWPNFIGTTHAHTNSLDTTPVKEAGRGRLETAREESKQEANRVARYVAN